jgi:hypothetical protein
MFDTGSAMVLVRFAASCRQVTALERPRDKHGCCHLLQLTPTLAMTKGSTANCFAA